MTKQLLAEMILPFPPSLNHYWRKDRNGVHISEEGKRYLSSIRQLVLLNGRGDTEFYLKGSSVSESGLYFSCLITGKGIWTIYSRSFLTA